jgi:NAD(P)H dehydrogenase (quinone)
MTIAVTGASGQLGRIVIADLIKAGHKADVVALVRMPSKAKDLGVALREADYARPETLVPALAGLDTLLLISSSEIGQRTVHHGNVIAAAKAAGVGRIVYTSLLHADTTTLDLAPEHIATEAALKASGVAYTILRNGWYTENSTGSLAGAVAAGALIGSLGTGRISSAARADFAAAAVAVLLGTGHEGKTYELAGDTSWGADDLSRAVSTVAGKQIPYNNLPPAAYADILKSFGLPAQFAAAIAGWDVEASKGVLMNDSRQLSALIGRPTTPLEDTVAAALTAASAAA